MPSKTPPRIRLEQVFVRDHQRRLQLVIDLLEHEFRQQHPLGTHAEVSTTEDNPTPLVAPHFHAGGNAL
jgi:hypothetical protein